MMLLAEGGSIIFKVNYSLLATIIIKERAHCSLSALAIIAVIAFIVFLPKRGKLYRFRTRKKPVSSYSVFLVQSNRK